LPALAGADELSGIGEMDAGVMGSFAQMVGDNEIAAGVRRTLRGFDVDDDSLAVDVISNVMKDQRNFITQKHTIKYLRADEILMTTLADRRTFAEWDRTERQGMVERTIAEAERILNEHEVPPLSDDQERHLKEVMQAAERDLVSK
jgi:trimethylamine--corrinoid protein Co-methyltransferase